MLLTFQSLPIVVSIIASLTNMKYANNTSALCDMFTYCMHTKDYGTELR